LEARFGPEVTRSGFPHSPGNGKSDIQQPAELVRLIHHGGRPLGRKLRGGLTERRALWPQIPEGPGPFLGPFSPGALAGSKTFFGPRGPKGLNWPWNCRGAQFHFPTYFGQFRGGKTFGRKGSPGTKPGNQGSPGPFPGALNRGIPKGFSLPPGKEPGRRGTRVSGGAPGDPFQISSLGGPP